MIINNLNTMFIRTAHEVFEKTTFTDIEIEELHNPADFTFENEYIAHINFKGDFTGCLYLDCSQNFAREITCSMLGLDNPQVEPERVQDTEREIVNMIMGRLLARIDENRKVASLELPMVTRVFESFARIKSSSDMKIFQIINNLSEPAPAAKLVLVIN